jgi:threonyl-tRNA synthetase
MLRAGMMRQEAAGIYAFLPLGLRVLDKICRIVREEQNRSGAIELLMPTIQSADLWRESGRYEAYGKEMLRIKDRHERDMLYGPTNEEMITEIVRAYVRSYKDLPLNLYHIQVEIPRRGAAALRRDARARIPDEGCIFVRHRPRPARGSPTTRCSLLTCAPSRGLA